MNIIEIKDIYAAELDVFARLSEAQLYRYYDPEPGIILDEGSLEASVAKLVTLIKE